MAVLVKVVMYDSSFKSFCIITVTKSTSFHNFTTNLFSGYFGYMNEIKPHNSLHYILTLLCNIFASTYNLQMKECYEDLCPA